jgi:chemotaxis protein MotA
MASSPMRNAASSSRPGPAGSAPVKLLRPQVKAAGPARPALDGLSLAGLLLALSAVLGAQLMEGGHLGALINPSAFLVVVGGSMGAVMLQVPWSVFRDAFARLPWVIRPPLRTPEVYLAMVVQWSRRARRDGPLALETLVDSESDRFTRRGLQMLVDGLSPAAIRGALELELDAIEGREFQAARVFESLGGYAPTAGILGAVLGLIQVMENLNEPNRLGAGIAAAFVATVYGVGLANLIFLPCASKLKTLARARCRDREILVEGLAGIAEGESPRNLERRLRGYLA